MGTKARRTFTAQFKLDAVVALFTGHTSVAQLCRARKITDQLVYDWKRVLVERASSIFETGATATREPHPRIAELARMVGRRTLEHEILKKAGRRSPSRWNGSER
jgi:transposase